jgi:hypothetical protein
VDVFERAVSFLDEVLEAADLAPIP